MIEMIKDGINRIKETKKYTRDKNVVTWPSEIIFSIIIVFTLSSVLSLFSIVLAADLIPNAPIYFIQLLPSLPFILTFLIMIQFGSYVIKLMILKSFYMQKALMKILNKLDMYLWKKTGKDSLATYYVTKYKLPIQIISFIPLIIWYLMP